MSILDRLRGKRDILVPYFDYCRLLRSNRESVTLRDIYALRYDVYCVERAPVTAAPGCDGQENDASDAFAVHIGAYGPGGQLAATVRLVQPPDGHDYPFHTYAGAFDPAALPPRAEAAEVSRLVVHKDFRRRAGDSLQGVARQFAEHGSTAAIGPATGRARQRSHGPLLLLGLYRELLRHSRAHGIRYWYALLDPAMAAALARMGFHFEPIGPAVPQCGDAALHLLDLDSFSARLRADNRFLAAWLADEPVSWWVRLRLLGQAMQLRAGR